jgi:RNA polymerase sigma factor (sigma-70 family)
LVRGSAELGEELIVGKGQDDVAIRGARMWLEVATLSALTDEDLLERFASGGGQSAGVAFAALVSRHGPMVLRTCRAALRNEHDAEDAFQASFLILARRGGTLWIHKSVGPWLHRVALRVATRARAVTARRIRRERNAAESRKESCESREPEDINRVLHAEIERLPERFRSPVILCDLEGLTHEEAASRVGCPVGTIKSRLTRARQRLRVRLERRGLVPAIGLGLSSRSNRHSRFPRDWH